MTFRWTRQALADWAEAEQSRFALFLPVWIAVGIGLYFAAPHEPAIWQPLAALAAAVSTTALLRRPAARYAALCVACACAGFTAATIATLRAPPWADVPRTAIIITGPVSLVENLPEGRRITIATPAFDEAAPQPRAVRVRLRATDATPLAAGDLMRVRALLRAPSPPAYPGGWDMQRDAYFHGLDAYGFAIGPATRVMEAPASNWQRLRAGVATRIQTALPGATGAIAAALLTGLGAAIPLPDRAAFQASGLAHLLAVAGLHIGIVMGCVFALTRTTLAASEHAALHWPVKTIAALAALTAGAFYLALTGAHVPILRSFAMASLATLAVVAGRRAVSMRALALAACWLLLASPEALLGVSFQMSFAVVLALLAGWESAAPRLRGLGLGTWWRQPARLLAGLTLTSAIAGTAALPFAAYHFGTATLFYIPANLLAVPITAFWVMPCGLLALALMPLGLESWALTPMGWGVRAILAIAHAVAAWPGAVLPIPAMPAWGLVLAAGGLIWLCGWRTRLRLAALPALLAGCAAPWLATQPDLVVSPDAQLIAIRTADGIFVHAGKAASLFDREDPARVWGATNTAPLPARDDCTPAACRLQLGTASVALLLAPTATCPAAALVVAPGPDTPVCPGPMVLDSASLRQSGAVAAYAGAAGITLVTDAALRGVRPWVLAPVQAVRARSGLPPALTE